MIPFHPSLAERRMLASRDEYLDRRDAVARVLASYEQAVQPAEVHPFRDAQQAEEAARSARSLIDRLAQRQLLGAARN